MSALPNELPPTPEELEAARQALRDANIRWGEMVGVREPELHDLRAPRTEQQLERVKDAGNHLGKLLAKQHHSAEHVNFAKGFSGIFRRTHRS